MLDPAVGSLADSPASTRTEEIRSFLFLSVVTAPVLAGLLVAGFGFVVWIYQMFAGPPGS
jgi:nitrate reductase NapE